MTNHPAAYDVVFVTPCRELTSRTPARTDQGCTARNSASRPSVNTEARSIPCRPDVPTSRSPSRVARRSTARQDVGQDQRNREEEQAEDEEQPGAVTPTRGDSRRPEGEGDPDERQHEPPDQVHVPNSPRGRPPRVIRCG